MKEPEKANMIDCEYGRCIGCKTFCCKLIVRLSKAEVQRLYPKDKNRLSLDKDLTDGYCEFLDKESFKCGVFEERPEICKSYTCNEDRLLQVAIQTPFTSVIDLVVKGQKQFIPKETWKRIPILDS